MKFLYFFVALIGRTLANQAYWDIANPVKDVVLINSTVNILSGNVTGYYYATSGWFESGDAGYFGWQPRAGQELQHLTFSAFGKGPYSDSPQCGDGADGGNGVSCALEYPWKFNQNYTISMQRTATNEKGDNKWTGWIIDDVTGEETLIAYYWTPKSYGLFGTSFNTFDEYYPLNGASGPLKDGDCLPKSKYIQYGPIVKTSNGDVYQTKNTGKRGDVSIEDKCSYAAQASNWRVTKITDTELLYENGILTE